jgi:hypothetical protein
VGATGPAVQASYSGTNPIVFGNGYFVTSEGYYSTDGSAWTAGTGLGTASQYYGIAYGNGTFVSVNAITSSVAAYSTNNGTTWTTVATAIGFITYTVTYGNGKFYAFGYNNSAGTPNIVSSTNGITWATVTTSASPSTNTWMASTFASGKFLAAGFTGGYLRLHRWCYLEYHWRCSVWFLHRCC